MSQLTSIFKILFKSVLFCVVFSPWFASSGSVNYQLGIPMQGNTNVRPSAPQLQYSLPRRFSTGTSVQHGLSYQPSYDSRPTAPLSRPTQSLLSHPMPVLGSVTPESTAPTSYSAGDQPQMPPYNPPNTPYQGIQDQAMTVPDSYSAPPPQPLTYAQGNIAHAVPSDLSSDDDSSKDSSKDDSSSDDCPKPSTNRQSSAANDWTIYQDGKVRRGRHHDVSHKAPVFSGSSSIHSQTAVLFVAFVVSFLAA